MPAKKSIARVALKVQAQDTKARSKEAPNPTLDSFVNFNQKMGVGADNPMSSGSYGFNPITRNRMLLDVVADDMTRAGIEIKSSLDPDHLAVVHEAAVRLKVWEGINDTIKWDRLYGGCIAVMLVDGQDQASPLRINTIRKDQFCGLLVLDRWMVDPSLNDLVTSFGPDLGMPKFYRVTAGAPALQGQTIHYSRCIRLGGVRMPYWQRLTENLWGISVLERLYDRLIAFDSATTGAAQLVYKSYLRTYKVDGLREVVAAGGKPLEGLVQYVDMMRRFQGIEGITLLDGKDTFEAHTHGAFSGLSEALAQFGQQLSGALQIPLVRLFGQSPSGFSSGDADLRNYYDGIKQKQEASLRIPLTTIYRLIAASEGIELPDGFRIEFNSLWQLTDEQKATIAATVTDTIIKAEEAGLISQQTAMKELQQSSSITGIFTNITNEDLEAAEAELPPQASEVLPGAGGGGATKPDTEE